MAGVLSVEALDVSIAGRPILDRVTLSIDEPQWFGLLGANGSGKTTLLRTLSGRLAPERGRIVLDGLDVTHTSEVRATAIGYAPALDTLPGMVTGGELLTLAADARRADWRRPADLRDALGVDELHDVPIESMSSGMRQRLALFLAFLGDPRVVLLDEPFNWLDPVGAYDAKTCLDELSKAVVVVTALHDVATFALRCRSGLLLSNGAVARRFEPTDLRDARPDVQGFERKIYASLKGAGRPDRPIG